MEGIKAITTTYKGFKFRSRLEARWAVFFDACGLVFEYEKEGFSFPGGTKYLPDFYIPSWDAYIEVKGPALDFDDSNKIYNLCAYSHKSVYVLRDMFSNSSAHVPFLHLMRYWFVDLDWDFIGVRNGSDFEFCECMTCHKILPGGVSEDWTVYELDNNYEHECEANLDIRTERINAAMLKAKQARFEWGESG